MRNYVKKKNVQAFTLMVAAFLCGASSANATGQREPRMKGKGAAMVLVMPDPVKAAIEKVAPGFQPWKWQDYLPWVREDFKKWDMKNAPYAVVADFNNDGVNDLVVDGHTDTYDALIAVVSTSHGYQAKIILQPEAGVSKPSEMKFYQDERGKAGRAGIGLKDWLQYDADEKQKDKSYAFTMSLSLIYDADGQPNWPGVAYYYFRKGKFVMECSGEMC